MASRRKQEEKHLQILKKLQLEPHNRECFECGQRGPTYVDVTIGSFVCTSCGGILRGINPPHRVKSISMTTFSQTEILFMQDRGNEFCKNVYLANYDERSKAKPESRNDHLKLKYFMELKYEQKKWYVSPDQQKKHSSSNSSTPKSEHTKPQAGIPQVQPLGNLMGSQTSQIVVQRSHPKPAYAAASTPSVTAATSGNKPPSGFADFDKVFGSVETAFSSQQPVASNSPSLFPQTQHTFHTGPQPQSQQPLFNTPSRSQTQPMNIMEPMNASSISSSAAKVSVAVSSSQDKYAALADLDFSINTSSNSSNAPIDVATFGWGSSPKTSQMQPNASAFSQTFATPQQQSLAPTTNNIFTPNTQAQPPWMQQTPQTSIFQQPPQGNMTVYQQQAAPKNPFLVGAPAPPSYQSLQINPQINQTQFGSWQTPNQFSQEKSVPVSNSNPFALPINGSAQPTQNPSNPFLF